MLAVFQKEIGSFFNSLIAYIVMAVFLTSVGLIVWIFPDSNVLDYGYADLASFFYLTPYVLLFLIPAITMRSFSEEIRNGTLELLLTKPLAIRDLILGKFFANWLLVILIFLPTALYYFSIYQLGNPKGNIDSAAVVGSYVGLILYSGVVVSIGLFTSALNSNQIVAFILAIFISFIFYTGFGAVSGLFGSGIIAEATSKLALDEQYRSLGKGLIDSRNVVYLFSLSLFFIYATFLRIKAFQS